LGMAPFIIKHPKLVHQWMYQYHLVIKQILTEELITIKKLNQFIELLKKAQNYLDEVPTNDDYQKKKNSESFSDLNKIIKFCENYKIKKNNNNWQNIINFSSQKLNYDAQEITYVQLIELYPSIADPLAENMSESDDMHLDVKENISSLIQHIESNYKWALDIDFNNKENLHLFWYISEEKLEPRLGERFNEEGAELEQPLGIGRMTYDLYSFLTINIKTHNYNVGKFLIHHPQFRGIIRRIQTLKNYNHGEVKDNILSKKQCL